MKILFFEYETRKEERNYFLRYIERKNKWADKIKKELVDAQIKIHLLEKQLELKGNSKLKFVKEFVSKNEITYYIDQLHDEFCNTFQVYEVRATGIQKHCCELNYDIHSNYISIVDFITTRHGNEDSGVGTELMHCLIEFAAKENCTNIVGRISHVDFDHLEKLKYFYGKFGFEIIDKGDSMPISLKLNSPTKDKL